MKILVTGATGFVGNAISRHLLAAGHQVRAMSRSTGGAMSVFAAGEAGRRGLADGSLTFVQADVTKPETLRDAVAGVVLIVQAAQFAGAPVEDPARGLTYMNVDLNGHLNVLEAVSAVYGRPQAAPGSDGSPDSGPGAGAAAAPSDGAAGATPRFLYVSGITVSPTSPYTWDKAKWQAEETIRKSGLEWTIVRCSPCYGKDDISFNRLVGYSDHLPFVPVFGDGKAALTPVFIEDVGRFFALLVAQPERCRNTTFGLGGPDAVTLDQLLQMMLRTMGRSRAIVHIPKTIGKAQAAVMQFLPGRLLTPASVAFIAAAAAATDEDRRAMAERFPEFTTTPLKVGLESYLRPTR